MDTTHPMPCSNCGGPTSNRGRKSKTGKRFCSNKGCQAAKARDRRQAFRTDREAPAVCTGCRAALPPRQWRAGDENGRWCRKSHCQARRREIQDDVAAGVDALSKVELLENAIALLADAVRADNEDYIGFGGNRVVCHECGLTSALIGWLHVTATKQPCRGTLGDVKKAPRVLAEHLWQAWPGPMEWLPVDERGE